MDKIETVYENHGLRNGYALERLDGVVIAGYTTWDAMGALEALNAGRPVLVIKPIGGEMIVEKFGPL